MKEDINLALFVVLVKRIKQTDLADILIISSRHIFYTKKKC